MEIKFKDSKPWLKEIEVTIDPETVKNKIEKITASYAHKTQIPGFRKGMAPQPILQKRYGATFEAMAVDEIIDESYKEIIETNKLQPITQAKVNDYVLSDDKTLKFELSFEIIPDFELKNYVGIKVKKQEPTGFDEEFDKRVKSLQERCATFTTLNRPAENDDYILSDYDILENDKPAGKKQNGVMIQVGSDKNMPEVNQVLVGAKSGDEKSATIIFKSDYPEPSLANRTLTYKFLVRDVKERNLPQIDDTFASDLGFKDLNELRNQINEEIIQDRAKIIDEDLKNQIYRYLTKEHAFEPPNVFVEQSYHEMLSEFNINDSEEAKQKLISHAQERAKFDIIVNRIAEKESIMPTPEQINQELQKFIAAGVKPEQVEPLRTNPNFIGRIVKNMVIDWLLQKAEIS
ncbi:MAG: trigger factor [Candidatus Latescibacteria bacterium]|nr:trigger factor [Candidatus Latescibacterota bacterium]